LIINVDSSHPIVPLTLAAADYSHVQSQQLHLELLVGPGKTLDRGNDPAHQQGLHWQHRVLRRWFGVRRNARFSFETLRSFLGKSTKMRLRIFVIFLSLSLVAQADWLRPNVDFSHYDIPLYEQIVNRIKVKISNRLGQGANTRDRYFIIPFAHENERNDPEFSHSFIPVFECSPTTNGPSSPRA
jgi:hypothetical protein